MQENVLVPCLNYFSIILKFSVISTDLSPQTENLEALSLARMVLSAVVVEKAKSV